MLSFAYQQEMVRKKIERINWLIKITRLERELGIDPWYAEFSEWLVSLHDKNYKPCTYGDLGLIVRRKKYGS